MLLPESYSSHWELSDDTKIIKKSSKILEFQPRKLQPISDDSPIFLAVLEDELGKFSENSYSTPLKIYSQFFSWNFDLFFIVATNYFQIPMNFLIFLKSAIAPR